MTYYNRQVVSISAAVYSNVYLTRQVISAKHFIDNNFADNITLDDICKEACISKFHMVRSFKKLYGTTPHQYLTSVRLKKAKTLLQNKASVAEVCYSVGFDSLTSFTALFKKKMGRAPSSFKP